MSSTKVWLTMTAEGIVWRDESGLPTYHMHYSDALHEAQQDYIDRSELWPDADPIDEVVSGTLNDDGSITLDDGYVITAQ